MSSKKRKYEQKSRAQTTTKTRERIAGATMELHREVGPANTTVAEIARRAGVTRLTVYNHFPDDRELFEACQARWMGLHPSPDLTAALALEDPELSLRSALRAYYRWYRETAPMVEKIQRDRADLPALDQLMSETADAGLAGLTLSLAVGFRTRGRRAIRQRALIRLALDFWTWRRLDAEGLDDDAAATAMASAVRGA